MRSFALSIGILSLVACGFGCSANYDDVESATADTAELVPAPTHGELLAAQARKTPVCGSY